MSEGASFNAEDHPELVAILRAIARNPESRKNYWRSVHYCECKKGKRERFAEVFCSPVGPILLSHGLATEGKDRQRRGPIVRYLARELYPDAAVSLQCRHRNWPLLLIRLAKDQGVVVHRRENI